MSNKPESDFERACAARWAGVFPARTPDMWDSLDRHKKLEERRGMLAALKAMLQSEPVWTSGAAGSPSWQSMLDELIRQGEQQGPGAD